MARAFKEAFANAAVVPQKSVYFVAFAGEELGAVGSAAFAKESKNGLANIPAECKVTGNRAASFLQGAEHAKDKRSDVPKVVDALIMDEIGWVTSNPSYPK